MSGIPRTCESKLFVRVMSLPKPGVLMGMSRPREVALIIDPTKPYDRRIVRGVATYVENEAVDWSLYVEEDPASRLPDLETWAGDGILANFDNRRVARAVSKLGIPVVGIGGGYGFYKQSTNVPYVRTDNRAIAEMAASHLFDLGLRHFAFCSEPPNRSNGWAKERQEAFHQIVADAGFSCEVYTGRHTAAQHWRPLQEELQNWLASLPRPVGLMVCNDGRARHVLQACRTKGLSVPEDIAIVGVDNDDIMCKLSRPSLTSIEQGTHRIGYEAAAILNGLMLGKQPQQRTAVPPECLVKRQSTDILAVEDEEVAAALKFIRHHACDPIQVKEVLLVAGLSRSTLEARFRDLLDRTVHAEIRRVQLENAVRLLKMSKMPIKEIVHEVGASSVQYFTAMIHRATGQTPGQIRNDARSGP